MKSKLFLVISIVAILLINSLLPILKATSHYTTVPEEMTYQVYKEKKIKDKRLDLTLKTNLIIKDYKVAMEEEYGLSPEDMLLLEPPGEMPVQVYTKFFFEDYFWYVENFVHVVSAVILFYSIFQFFLIKEMDENEIYLNLDRLVTKTNEEQVEPDLLDLYLANDFNRPRKIKQHLTNINNKLAKLENRTKPKTRANVANKENIVLKRKERRYLRKKEKLERLKSKEYIEEFIDSIRVKHFKKVTTNFIYSGDNKLEKAVDSYSGIKTNRERLQKDGLRKVGLSVLITLSFASVITLLAVNVENQTALEVFINAVMKLTPLLLQIKLGIDYKTDFMNTQLMSNLRQRYNIIAMFLKHTSTNEYKEENL